ncbi:MAG: hypothetical protein V4850_37095 [Myxococcota bacterium]
MNISRHLLPFLLANAIAWLPACDAPADGETGETPERTVAQLGGAVALIQLEGENVLKRQLADDTLEPVLPAEALLAWFVTTETHAYAQLTTPMWVQGDAGGQWCTLLDIPLDAGDTAPVRCIARTVESDPDVPPVSDELPIEVSAYDETDVWVLWKIEHAENEQFYEVWGHRDGVGAFVTGVGVTSLGRAVEGGLLIENAYWTLDGGLSVDALAATPSATRWGPYQFVDEWEYALFRGAEGIVQLRDVMAGDPYCATYLSDSSTRMMSDGPNLIVKIGTQWDGAPDVPPSYCRCALDLDCQVVSDDEKAALQRTSFRFESPLHPDGIAYEAEGESVHLMHDGAVSSDLGADYVPGRFFQWGHDLYFTEVGVERVLYRADWVEGDAVVTKLPMYEANVAHLVRLR